MVSSSQGFNWIHQVCSCLQKSSRRYITMLGPREGGGRQHTKTWGDSDEEPLLFCAVRCRKRSVLSLAKQLCFEPAWLAGGLDPMAVLSSPHFAMSLWIRNDVPCVINVFHFTSVDVEFCPRVGPSISVGIGSPPSPSLLCRLMGDQLLFELECVSASVN